MKRIALVLLLSISMSSFSQKVVDSVFSKKQNVFRKIGITLPRNYSPNGNKSYPVIYLLDGEYLHDAFLGTLDYSAYWSDLPDMILVSLYQNQNEERTTDCAIDPQTGLPDKTGNVFFEFFGGEVVPYIEKKFKTAPFRIVAGHDLTAGFSNFYLHKDNPLFNAYINLSPEFPEGMIDNLPALCAKTNKKIFLYMCVADGDNDDLKTNAQEMDKAMKVIDSKNFSYLYDEFQNTTHYSVVLQAVPRALYHIFASYQPISINEYKEKIVKLSSGYALYLKDKYELAESSLGYKVPGRYNDFRAIEAAIIKNKAFGEFELLSQMAHKSFPKTMLGDYYLARFYEAQGNVQQATKSYQKAFTLSPIGELTKDVIVDKIREMKSATAKLKSAPKDAPPATDAPPAEGSATQAPTDTATPTPTEETPKEEKKEDGKN